ncbi:flagellin [Thermoanaerobacter wiegelii]|uniref:Flagellin n=1 Tax=Thermoanaerobacter wiegelii Rt8.B1 TaxID=697303 RepID=G2MV64_9THEO|nr:flagellin [Thermoanaerobacter wiegelii]AEM78243.1 flagellin domain protein [Thermoanaerobacter wiegelii Rt8.B1]
MRVSHNLMVLNTLENIRKNNKITLKSIEKLSSGLRINKAADDAAGLSISEKMRAQIRGLRQAERNVQDGISLIQTADAGLSSILEPPLQRMRELAIQAMNDTLTDEDRQKIQLEIEQMKSAIDDIANNTEFNGIKLLNGNLRSVIPQIPLSIEWEKSFSTDKLINSIIATNDGGFIVGGASHKWEPEESRFWISKIDSEGNIEWEIELPKQNNYNYIYDIEKISDGNFVATARSNKYINGEYGENQPIVFKFDSSGNIIKQYTFAGTNSYLLAITQTINGNIIATGSANELLIMKFDQNLNFIENRFWQFPNPADCHFKGGYDIKPTKDGGFVIVGLEALEDGGRRGFIAKFDINLNMEWEQKIQDEELSSVVQLDNENYLVLGENGLYKIDSWGNINILNDMIKYWNTNTGIKNANNIFLKLDNNNYVVCSNSKVYKINNNGDEIWSLNLPISMPEIKGIAQIDDGGFVVVENDYSIIKFAPENPITKNGIFLQIGPNSNENLNITIENCSTRGLGIKEINVTTRDIENAILAIDSAIEKVTSERSKLGAYQNALEHVYNNLLNYEENLMASESRIRDADIAKEIMNFVKGNILHHTSQVVLAQANQTPETVIQLLK